MYVIAKNEKPMLFVKFQKISAILSGSKILVKVELRTSGLRTNPNYF